MEGQLSDLVSDAIAARPASHAILLLLEFDAALRDPGDPSPWVAPHRRACLARLANQPDILVAILGMRRAADLAARVGLGDPVLYLGLQGLEIRGHGFDVVHPDAVASRGLMWRIARSLDALTDEIPGVRLENHGLALSLQLRGASATDADRAEDALYRVAGAHLADNLLNCYRGADAFELLPVVASGERDAYATVVAGLAKPHGRPIWPVCVADDVRGAELFDTVASTGLTVAVGPRPSRAKLRLRDSADVDDVLGRLLA